MAIDPKISQIRRDYNKGTFSENTAQSDPLEQFKIWFQNAIDVQMLEPTAMTLSTVSKEGKPSSRVVLLKSYDERGYVFFTNYESKKGNDMFDNPNISLLFFWDKLERQVRIEGKVEKISAEESDEYYQTRPYTSRLGAWASQQSRPLSGRFKLLREVAKVMAKYPVNPPLPPFWGGYRLVPEYYEFWQGRESRLHDRIIYTLNENNWNKARLYP